MSQDERRLLDAVRRVLDRDADALEAPIRARLSAARQRALDARRAPRRTSRILLPAAAVMASAVLAVAIVSLLGDHPRHRPPAVPALELVLVDDADLELIESLEFYQWLDLTGYAAG